MPTPPRDASLDWALRYQAGWGRKPTTAHPSCACSVVGGIVVESSVAACPMHGTGVPSPA